MITGLDKRFVAVDATPYTVFPAAFAIVPSVFPATFDTAPIAFPIDDVTVPTNCSGIEIRLFNSPPVVEIICEGIPRSESRNICVLYIVK